MRTCKEGWLFILPPLALAVVAALLGWWLPFVFFLLLSLGLAFFFRDPNRRIPEGQNLLLAPADGKIVKIETFDSHPWFPSRVSVISIFLALYDVHVNRAPVSGVIEKTVYQPGTFFPAYREEAGRKNESNTLFIKGDVVDVVLRQIVGFAARRIKCYVEESDRIEKGQKIGLMYFGSRIDLYVPSDVSLKVGPGRKVRAGETVLGEVNNEKTIP